MFSLSDTEAAAIRAAFDDDGDLVAALCSHRRQLDRGVSASAAAIEAQRDFMTTLEGMLSIAWGVGLLLGPSLLLMRGPAVHKPGSVSTPSRQRDNSSSSIVNDTTTDHGDDPRQILIQGLLLPGVRAAAAAAGRTAAARAAC